MVEGVSSWRRGNGGAREEEEEDIIRRSSTDQGRIGLRDIRGVLPCILTLVLLVIIVLTVFPYVFSSVFR